MRNKDIDYVVKHKTWSPDSENIASDYFIVYLLPLFLIIISLVLLSSGLNRGGFNSEVWIAIFIFIGAVILFRFLTRRLKRINAFIEISLIGDVETIRAAIKLVGWHLVEQSDRYIIATTNLSLFSWGETITIVFIENGLLFNSKPNKQVITFNARESDNLKKLQKALETFC